jgi:hypothetical protein
MSVLLEREIPCSHCRFPNSVEIWSIVNVKEDPELKDLLLGGELNMAECASCHKIFYAEHFLLYHDPEAELLAFVYPFEARSERATYEEKTRQDFEALKAASESASAFSYAPLTFFGLDELVRLLEEEEAMGIQAEIVAAMAPQIKLPTAAIRPSVARGQHIPWVVPGFDKSDRFDRAKLLSALRKVEEANSHLSVYADWLKTADQNPQYEIHFD